MTASTMRQVAPPDEHQRGARVAAQMAAQRSIAELIGPEPLSVHNHKLKPLLEAPMSPPQPPNSVFGGDAGAHGEAFENHIREELGLLPRRVASAQPRATSDSALQSAASLDLAWRVVLAAEQRVAEQRKAAIVDNPRPHLGHRNRLPKDRPSHETPDRPTAAHGSQAVLSLADGSGGLKVSALPARNGARSGRTGTWNPSNSIVTEGDPRDLEECERIAREIRGGGVNAVQARQRRGPQQSSPGGDCGIAVSGQSIRQPHRPIANGSGWTVPPWSLDGRPDAEAAPPVQRVLLEAYPGETPSPPVGVAAPPPTKAQLQDELSELQRQAELLWQAQCSGGPDHEVPERIVHVKSEPSSSPEFGPKGSDASADQSWNETEANSELWPPEARPHSTNDISPAQAQGSVPGSAGPQGQAQEREGVQPALATTERANGTGAPAASARSNRRASGNTAVTANRTTSGSGAAASSAAAPSAQEPFSPQRRINAACTDGASIRRSRSMPAARKSAEESGQKNKTVRSSFARRSAAPGSTSMPKSTTAAAAGAGAVAAKKRARKSQKLMLPFVYAEDDPRIGHVESADGRIVPEFLP